MEMLIKIGLFSIPVLVAIIYFAYLKGYKAGMEFGMSLSKKAVTE